MPKIQKLRKHKVDGNKPYAVKARPETTEPSSAELSTEGSRKVLSRGQKKRQEKKNRIANLKTMVQKGIDNRANQINPQSFLFSDLESSLPQKDDVIRPSAVAPRTNKMKGKVAVREVERMRLIQEHPSFKQDPLSALKFHIEHMVTVQTSSSN